MQQEHTPHRKSNIPNIEIIDLDKNPEDIYREDPKDIAFEESEDITCEDSEDTAFEDSQDSAFEDPEDEPAKSGGSARRLIWLSLIHI